MDATIDGGWLLDASVRGAELVEVQLDEGP